MSGMTFRFVWPGEKQTLMQLCVMGCGELGPYLHEGAVLPQRLCGVCLFLSLSGAEPGQQSHAPAPHPSQDEVRDWVQ